MPSRRLCYDGTRGTAFRVFKRDFLTKARARFGKDDRHSFHTCAGEEQLAASALRDEVGALGVRLATMEQELREEKGASHYFENEYLKAKRALPPRKAFAYEMYNQTTASGYRRFRAVYRWPPHRSDLRQASLPFNVSGLTFSVL